MNCIPPIAGNPRISQQYGTNPGGSNPPGGHNGRDYAVPEGTPVLAVADGVIEFEGWTSGDYWTNPWWFLPGDMVIVLNTGDAGPSFVYGHLSQTLVTGGEHVTQGQVIGYTGNTGNSTGPHLHFEAFAPGYDLNNGMYGRTDPGPYIDNPPTITEQEPVMPTADEIARAVLTYQVPHKDPVTGHDDGQTTSLATMAGFFDYQNAATRRENQNPATIAAQLTAAGIGQAVLTELSALLTKAAQS